MNVPKNNYDYKTNRIKESYLKAYGIINKINKIMPFKTQSIEKKNNNLNMQKNNDNNGFNNSNYSYLFKNYSFNKANNIQNNKVPYHLL